ncbi:hypothetical protein R6Z07F_019443 [Ovis aries]
MLRRFFAPLLLPTRYPSRNWEVDVAAQLGEYLKELDQICIPFDKGKTTMGFTEAAQLMQGSAGDQVPSGALIRLLPDAPVAPDEMKNSNPLYSHQGEVLARRKDFRMTARPRIRFLLEPVRVSLMEALLPRNQKEPGRVEEQPMEVSVWGSSGPVLSISQEPGTSPEGPVPRSRGAEEAEENAERTAKPTEASAPEVPIEPQEPRADCCPLREQKGALKPASWLQETPNSWQGLEPFHSLDSERCRKGRPYPMPPAWRGRQDRSERGRVASSCRTSTRGTRPHAISRRPWRKGPSFAAKEVLYWKHGREQLETLQKLQRRKPVEEDHLKDCVEDLGAADDLPEPEGYTEPKGKRQTGKRQPRQCPCALFVTAWKQELIQETELKQHEEHVPFDIHTCGAQVSRFSQLNQWRPSAKLVVGQPAFELANDNTVEVTQQPGLEVAVDTMSLSLLTYQQAHEHPDLCARAPALKEPEAETRRSRAAQRRTRQSTGPVRSKASAVKGFRQVLLFSLDSQPTDYLWLLYAHPSLALEPV